MRMTRVRRTGKRLLHLVAGVLVTALCTIVVIGWWARPDHPGKFYSDPGAKGPPGTLVRVQPFSRELPPGAHGWRMLYITTRADGTSSLASALVLAPAASDDGAGNVVLWMHGTTGVATGCAPSLLDHPFANTPALQAALRKGWRIVAPDYAGLGAGSRRHGYLIGPDEARSGLDAVRAARHVPGLDAGSATVVWGHSQGGHAALWTGIIEPGYAPDVPLSGVAALAPATDLPALVRAAQDSVVGRVLSSYILSAYAGNYADIDMDRSVRRGARWITRDMAGRCMDGAKALVPVAESLLLDGSVFAHDPGSGAMGARLAANTPDRPIRAPLLIAQGAADDLVLPSIQAHYVASRCEAGQAIEYKVYPGLDHLSLVAPGSPLDADLLHWTAQRFAGAPASSNCPNPAPH